MTNAAPALLHLSQNPSLLNCSVTTCFELLLTVGSLHFNLLLTLDFIAEEILTSKRAVGSLRVFEATSKEAATLLWLNVHWGRCDQIIL